MEEDVGVIAAGVFEGVGQDREAVVVKGAGGEDAIFIGGGCECHYGGRPPGRARTIGRKGLPKIQSDNHRPGHSTWHKNEDTRESQGECRTQPSASLAAASKRRLTASIALHSPPDRTASGRAPTWTNRVNRVTPSALLAGQLFQNHSSKS